jgi:hypothetical protein
VNKKWIPVIAVGLGLAIVVALFSPLASSHPDGLERVAEDEGFIEEAKDPPYEIIADYVFPGVENEEVATILSGVIGVALVAAVGFGLAFGMKALSRKNSGRGADRSSLPQSGRG